MALYPAASSAWPSQNTNPKSESTRRIVALQFLSDSAPRFPAMKIQGFYQTQINGTKITQPFKMAASQFEVQLLSFSNHKEIYCDGSHKFGTFVQFWYLN
jgi:hypothetical protein